MDDLISRQAAIDAVRKAKDKSEAHRMLIQLPSAKPDVPDTNVGDTDCISRADVIELVNNSYYNLAESIEDTWAMVADVEKLPSVTPKQPGWIPVTERLPESDMDVLVTDGEDCAVAYWRKDAQAWDDSFHGWCDLYGLDVVAWMPLPEPWEGGQDGTD